ncbi:MAG TPA: hypothetical protein VI759_00875 [Dehalococcoidia bacterium]|nr:hypothetical protein [Dehalococcoidia bacterium]
MVKKVQTKPELKKPENFDWKKGEATIKKLIEENLEWLKEMAKK